MQQGTARSANAQLSSARNLDRMIFRDPSRRRSRWLRKAGMVLGIFSGILLALFLASLVLTPVSPSVPGITHRLEAQAPAGNVRSNDTAEGALRQREFERRATRESQPFQTLAPSGARGVVAAFYAPWRETGLHSLRALFRQRFRWTFGTLQSLWKHRDALGRYGWFGCVLLPSLWLFQIALQTLAPLVDLQVLWALGAAALSWFNRQHMPQHSDLLFHETNTAYSIGLMYGLFFLVELSSSVIAFKLDRERMRLLWWLFWQRLAYRQLMYLVLFKSLLTAAQGIPAHWVKVQRTGKVRLRYEGASIDGLRCASEGTSP